ncbi:MAG: hypothetical protein AB7P07_09730 [Hyphomonadaceae bacterium]
MPVVLRHNEKLEVNRVEYHGAVTLQELKDLAAFQAANPAWLTFDCLSFVASGADFHAVSLAQLDTLFAEYRALFEPLHFLIMRRSAWLCQSDAARAHVRYWIGDRDAKSEMSSDVRQFETYAEAGEWLVLSASGSAALESGEGFVDIVRFEDRAPALAR